MPRKTKEEAERTRTRILASALSLFVKKGYDHTTFTDIAARLKMTKGAVYWHFESKESLLVALVDEMLTKFHRQMDELMSTTSLTFPAVAKMMVEGAVRTVEDPKGAAFFLLMQTQIKWGSESMDKAREELMAGTANGPYHAFIQAVENDISEGRVRKDVSPIAIASVGMSVWNGMVRSRIEKFLECDLATTLQHTYDAMWEAIKIRGLEV